MRVLIVDDHNFFREGLVSLVKSQPDFEVVGESGTVKDAIDDSLRLKPDLVLMDFNLPDGTGLEATRAILQKEPGIKIVFLTIQESDESLLEALHLGARGYLLKNLSVTSLINSLHSIEQGDPAISPAQINVVLKELTRNNVAQETPPLMHLLTTREIEILGLLAGNLTNQEIALKLFVSENTVKNHVHSILKKLNLGNRREAAQYARQYKKFLNGSAL